MRIIKKILDIKDAVSIRFKRFVMRFYKGNLQIITVFPKGTIVKYGGVPCELLCDTPYYSATFQPKSKNV